MFCSLRGGGGGAASHWPHIIHASPLKSSFAEGLRLAPAETMDHSGSPCLKEGMESVWAKYMAKWVASYKARVIWFVLGQHTRTLKYRIGGGG